MELSHLNLNSLIQQYSPYFVFSKEEMYYPCSAEYIISHSQLFLDEDIIADYGHVTPELLAKNVGNNLKVDPNSYRGQIETAPIYYFTRISETFIDIVYCLYFTFSGPYSILGKHMGHHDTDLEHIVVRLDKETKQLVGIYFSAHSTEGIWVSGKYVQFENDHPLVYVAKFSHAMYHRQGRHIRILGFANDVTDDGFVWKTDLLIEADEKNLVWMNYTGQWSKEGIDSLVNKQWWKQQPDKNSNWFTRLFPLKSIREHFMTKVNFDKMKKEFEE